MANEIQLPLYIEVATLKIFYRDATGTFIEVGGSGAAGAHNILSSTHLDADAGDTPADRDLLMWESGAGDWIAQKPDASRVVSILEQRSGTETTTTVNVNSTTYLQFSSLRCGWDFALAPMTHFRILGRAQSSAAGQTITGQLATSAAPTTGLSAGGDDFITNSVPSLIDIDTGWIAFATPPVVFTLLGISLKGSSSTTDLLHTFLQVLLKNDP